MTLVLGLEKIYITVVIFAQFRNVGSRLINFPFYSSMLYLQFSPYKILTQKFHMTSLRRKSTPSLSTWIIFHDHRVSSELQTLTSFPKFSFSSYQVADQKSKIATGPWFYPLRPQTKQLTRLGYSNFIE